MGSGLYATQWFRQTCSFIVWPHHPLGPHCQPQTVKGRKQKPGDHIVTSPALIWIGHTFLPLTSQSIAQPFSSSSQSKKFEPAMHIQQGAH